MSATSWLHGPPVRDFRSRSVALSRADARAFARRAFGKAGRAVADGPFRKIGRTVGGEFVEEGRGLTWGDAIYDAKPLSRHEPQEHAA